LGKKEQVLSLLHQVSELRLLIELPRRRVRLQLYEQLPLTLTLEKRMPLERPKLERLTLEKRMQLERLTLEKRLKLERQKMELPELLFSFALRLLES
jgi:hypothetical protein